MLTRRAFVGRLAALLGAVAAVTPVLEASAPSIDPVVAVTITDQANIAYEFRKGDVITIADRYAINPLTLRTTDRLKQFVVTQAATATEIAAWPEMTIQPTLIGPGSPYQNVSSASPFEPSDVWPGYAGQFTKPIEIDWSKHISVAWEGLGS